MNCSLTLINKQYKYKIYYWIYGSTFFPTTALLPISSPMGGDSSMVKSSSSVPESVSSNAFFSQTDIQNGLSGKGIYLWQTPFLS